MRCLVTGAAGFIGSHLCEALLSLGNDVIGVDAFLPNYPEAIKQQNHKEVEGRANYRFERLDLRFDGLDHVVNDAEVIFHLAAIPGLEQSWNDFDTYCSCNVGATRRLLEAARRLKGGLQSFVYASTSSVYGRYSAGDESLPTRPISPYGVTKLAGENLCRAYGDAYGLPIVVLRYFSVYGPRQRPDMGYYRFIDALLRGKPIVVYGDGEQVRGNTYVDDCVRATIGVTKAQSGEVYNVGGGETASVWNILRKLEKLAGRSATVKQEVARPGDQRYTFADTTKLRRHLGWEPRVSLDQGLALQLEWQEQRILSLEAKGSLCAHAPNRESAVK